MRKVLYVDEESIRIEAAPDVVWALLADITRMPEWSPNLRRCTWRGEEQCAVAGARFTGFNRLGPLTVPMPNVVERAEPAQEFSFRTGLHNTLWRYVLTADGAGTVVTEQRDTSATRHWLMRPMYGISGGREKFAASFREGMRETLRALKTAAER